MDVSTVFVWIISIIFILVFVGLGIYFAIKNNTGNKSLPISGNVVSSCPRGCNNCFPSSNCHSGFATRVGGYAVCCRQS